MTDEGEQSARVGLSRSCEPGSAAVHAAIAVYGATAVWDSLRRGLPVGSISTVLAEGARLRAEGYHPGRDLELLLAGGGRLLCPQDNEWPTDRLTWCGSPRDAPPLVLYLRGPLLLDQLVERSVSLVGARAASAYGSYVAKDLALGLADLGWSVISGGAYGIDGAAHAGALLSERAGTAAVLACGVDVAYPRGHARLLAEVAERGLVVSEVPPGTSPTRSRFLVRNRVIAALSVGTVVVEAAARSGSLTTARLAGDLGRVVMAVPGSVTSVMSGGSNQLLRDGAICVTSAAEVLDGLGRLGEDAAPRRRAPVQPRDELSAVVRQVLEAVPVRQWAGEASIARAAGVPALTVMQVLPPLQVAGLVEQGLAGWRLTALGAGRPVGRARMPDARAAP